MWTRVELKNYAKDFLKKYYWKAFLVCLIAIILNSSPTRKNTEISNRNRYNQIYEYNYSNTGEIRNIGKVAVEPNFYGFNYFLKILKRAPIFYINSSIYLAMGIFFIVFGIIVGNNIQVGKNRFFLNGFKEDADIKYIISTFNRDEFWNVAKNMFIMNLYIALWGLLLVIPGIIKSYEYKMVPYLLAEDADLSISDAIAKSRAMTEGHKWDIFVLDLSFLGWQLLGLLFFGIGELFVAPYSEATFARLYEVLYFEDSNDDNFEDQNSILLD